jgi:hypothetical protein
MISYKGLTTFIPLLHVLPLEMGNVKGLTAFTPLLTFFPWKWGMMKA